MLPASEEMFTMSPLIALFFNSGRKAFMHMYDAAVAPEDLVLLARSDHLGKKDPADPDARERLLDSWKEPELKLNEMLRLYRDYMSQPGVRGQDLIDAGLTPGPDFTLALSYAHKLRLAGVDRDSALKQTLSYMNRMKKK